VEKSAENQQKITEIQQNSDEISKKSAQNQHKSANKTTDNKYKKKPKGVSFFSRHGSYLEFFF
jgi:hypothetical protein